MADGFSLSSFQDFVQNTAGNYLNTKYQAQYQGNLDLKKMELMAQNSYGWPYVEGQAIPTNMLPAQGFMGIPAPWLLIGGVVLAVVLLKDD